MRVGWVLAAVVVLAAAIVVGFAALAWRVEIEPTEPQEATAFDPKLVSKGAQLAAVGNCIACHTVPGSKAFAGGLPLPTPFGTIYSTNITPDPESGIGRWSEAAFRRAMHEGVDRAGNHLYPAFPYDHFTRVTDADIGALYAYLMTRRAVAATAPENDLPFPLNIRLVVAGWKILFFREGVFQPDRLQSEEWNRGAYLAEGLGHCGGCHTPRNALGAEKHNAHFAGGEAEGWVAYALNSASPSPVPWDKEAIALYLRHGWHAEHGVSRGPMAEVTGNLAGLPDSDIEAIATYVAWLMGEPSAERLKRAEEIVQEVDSRGDAPAPTADSQAAADSDGTSADGAAIYASTCAPCHESGRKPPFGGLHFALSTAVNSPDPQNIVNVTLFGLPAADGAPSAVMPGFAGVLTDAEVASLLDFMRDRFTEKSDWQGVEEMARATRTGEYKVSIRPSDGIERAPENVGAED